ncbi:DegT/DnrJ/EryC1/StrS family aminotransferase [Desulfolithobacter sp.]
MKVPLLDLQPQMQPLREEILTAVTAVIDSTRYILGPEVVGLENEIAGYCGAHSGVGVSSGTDALLVSLMALGIGQGDLVLTTPYTFFATMGSIIRTGALPVFCDIDPVSFNLDPEAVAGILEEDSRKGKRIRAIMPVHLFGQCAAMEKILDLARSYEVPVIEDAAQAIGAEYPMMTEQGVVWKRAGSMGDTGCFSFFPSKNLGGIGDGGMVTTNDPVLADRLHSLRNHGAESKYFHASVGGNFRLDPVQATVLRIKLAHLESWHRGRRRNSEKYRQYFSDAGLNGNPVQLPEAVYRDYPGAAEHNFHIYNQFVIRVPRRDELRTYLQEHEIGCEVYYPLCLHQQECLKSLSTESGRFPVAEQAAKESLALPIYPELSDAQIQYVVETVHSFYHR